MGNYDENTNQCFCSPEGFPCLALRFRVCNHLIRLSHKITPFASILINILIPECGLGYKEETLYFYFRINIILRMKTNKKLQ